MKSIYLVITLIFFSCMEEAEEPVSSQDQQENNENDTDDENTDDEMGQLTFLALGDSYTIGESVQTNERWPVQLVEDLRKANIDMADPQIIARTGWTTDDLIGAINNANTNQPYDLVSLLIGVNNQYRGYPISQQEKEFEELLKMAIGFAGGDPSKVFVVSIPDYGVTPFGQNRNPEQIASEIDEYNALNKRIAGEYEVKYFDITPISREAEETPSYVANDGLHPSGEMYNAWVAMIFPWAKENLAE